jgi:hypothetical protein
MEGRMEKRLKNLEDAYKWSKETVEALRTGNFAAIDTDALVDEIASIASGIERTLESTLRDILEALLWKQYTNADPHEIDKQLLLAQVRLQSLFQSTPSLHDAMTESVIDDAYQTARKFVSEDYGVALPDHCPFSLEQILEDPIERLVAQGRLV